MGAPNGYFEGFGWYFYSGVLMPTRSVFPNQMGGPRWLLGDIPEDSANGKGGLKSIQGWKLHVTAAPGDIRSLYKSIHKTLQQEQVAHKFHPFDEYDNQSTSSARAGKACAIYSTDPPQIRRIVPNIEKAISKAINAFTIRRPTALELRPFVGGIPGDLELGSNGFVYCRYGGFSGKLANLPSPMLWDPNTNTRVLDPREARPFPSFIKVVPADIFQVSRGRMN